MSINVTLVTQIFSVVICDENRHVLYVPRVLVSALMLTRLEARVVNEMPNNYKRTCMLQHWRRDMHDCLGSVILTHCRPIIK